MEIASVVFEHEFDKTLLDQIGTLRTIRLQMAESMLKDLNRTAAELTERGLIEANATSQEELRQEVMSRIATLRDRLDKPDVVHADEISFFIDLVADGTYDEIQG